MAGFNLELPNDLIDNLKSIEENSEEMFGRMTRAGAEVVYNDIQSNMKKSFKSTESLDKGLKITKVYKTKSDDGINTKVGFYGYNDKGVPIPLIAMAREFGTSSGEKKKPFFRKAFKKVNEIESAMLKVQKEYIDEK
jgi:HK97 gp10 family phage protein